MLIFKVNHFISPACLTTVSLQGQELYSSPLIHVYPGILWASVHSAYSMNIIFPQLGTSPLHLAAQYGHYSTAEVLLRAGVSRDARTKVDRTPLHMAAADGHAHIVELLVRVKQGQWQSFVV